MSAARKEQSKVDGAELTPHWVRTVFLVLAAVYLAELWLEGVGSAIPAETLPRPALFFVQAAILFARAEEVSIDYRAEAWVCDEHRWTEIDTRPYFQINREDKESRFYRTLQFYREHRATLQALERYLIASHESGGADDGIPHDKHIGGVRFLSLREPLPKLGDHVERWHRVPMVNFPKEQQHRWYWTPRSKRAERCGGPAPTPAEDE